jgi:hypothetical protein
MFDAARIALNDALMAIMVGMRLAVDRLAKLPFHQQLEFLPSLFPDVEEAARLHRTSEDAARLIRGAEIDLTHMAIPYVLSLYNSYLVDSIFLLRRARLDTRIRDPWRIPLGELHDYMTKIGVQLPRAEVEVFDFMRLVRNRIIHYAGAQGAEVAEAYRSLSPPAKTIYFRTAGRDFRVGLDTEQMRLSVEDVRPALAVTKHLAEAVNGELARKVNKGFWLDVLISDYFNTHPKRVSREQLIKGITGYAAFHYQALSLNSDEVAEAVKKILKNMEEERGSTR